MTLVSRRVTSTYNNHHSDESNETMGTKFPEKKPDVVTEKVNQMSDAPARAVKKKRAAPKDRGAHYRFEYRGIKLDPYRVARVCGMEGGPREHILKKVMRGVAKGLTEKELVEEVQCCVDRWREMVSEDQFYDDEEEIDDFDEE